MNKASAHPGSEGKPIVDLRTRTKQFALSIIRLYSTLPRRDETLVIGRQFLRSGTSVGAHYREAHRARSDAEFVSKMEGALQELDETSYWLDLLADSCPTSKESIAPLLAETDELIRIFVASVRTVKKKG